MARRGDREERERWMREHSRGRGPWRDDEALRRGREPEEYEPRRGAPPRGEWNERGVRPKPWLDAEELAGTRGGTRGMYEWEDRGPLAWLRDRGEKPRGPKGYRRSDERIQDEVCERIARSGMDASEVEVKVENGRVTLQGTVPIREWKWHLEDLADDVYGVDEVQNELRVSRPREGQGGEGEAGARFRH